MPSEHTTPPPAEPVRGPIWIHRALLLLGMGLLATSLVSEGGFVKGFTVAAGAGVLAAALALLVNRRKATRNR